MYKLILAFLLITSSCACPHRYYASEDPCPPEPFEVPESIRIALVLGSGGVKGMVHVGVLEELDKAGIKFDLIVGSSAGALVGALYSDNPSIECLKKSVEEMRTNNLLDINMFTCRYGLSQGQYLRRMLSRNLTARCFDDLSIPLVVVATDLYSAELVPIGAGELIPALQASCSIPFVFAPVIYRDRILVDGGVVNPLPVCVAKDLGADIVIAVDLCEILPQTVPNNIFSVTRRSAEIAFIWQSSQCITKGTIVIKPKICEVGTFNDTIKQELYEAGREACIEALPLIRAEIAKRVNDYHCTDKKLVALPCYKPY